MRWHIALLWLASGSAGDRADSIYNGLCNQGGESMSGDASPFNMLLGFGLMTEVNIWAALYYTWGNVGSYANAVYFSMASFTTIGASDVLSLSPAHRVVGAQEAGVGMLMFGWTTALLMEV